MAPDPNIFSFNLSSYNFGSETANSEYSKLWNMLNARGNTPSDANADPESHPTLMSDANADPTQVSDVEYSDDDRVRFRGYS